MPRVEPAFKIKTVNSPLFVLYVNTVDIDQLKQQLEMRFSNAQAFFSNSPVALDLSNITDCSAVPDFSDLAAFMLKHGMRAAGVMGGSVEQRAAAVQSGLGLFPDTVARMASKPEPAPMPTIDASPGAAGLDLFEMAEKTARKEQPGSAGIPGKGTVDQKTASRIQPAFRPTMTVDKPVRTGQRIYAEGSNLVVLAVVNAGAELIADGDIHIYAPLRGRAIAGAQGNENARIFANCLEAELISIAGCFKVFESGIPGHLRGQPVQAFLEDTNLIIQPLLS